MSWLLLLLLMGQVPTPQIVLMKPAEVLEVSPGGQAHLEMMGTHLELFRYGHVLQERKRSRSFTVELSDPSRDGTRRELDLKAEADTPPGVYELRLFTPKTSVKVPLEVQVR